MMLVLYEYYKLIEKDTSLVSVIWKGAHIAVFLATFLCGALCSFGFNSLTSTLHDNCVLFPRTMRLTSPRDELAAYGLIPLDLEDDDESESSVAFISTQWSDQSTCYLPVHMPLFSAIFALVWTAMFLICSTGGRSVSGLLRPWRVLVPGFVFSVSMAALCAYASYFTHRGIGDLISKLSDITDKYAGDVRGVHSHARLTVATAWLHTTCWLAAAGLMLARVVLGVDFQLVRVQVVLRDDLDRLLDNYQDQLRFESAEETPSTVEPTTDLKSDAQPIVMPKESRVQFRNKTYMSKSDNIHVNQRMNDQRIPQSEINFGVWKFLSHADLRSVSEIIPEVSGYQTGLGMRSFKITSKDTLHDIYRAGSTEQVSSVESSRSRGGAAQKTHLNNAQPALMPKESSKRAQFRKKTYMSKSDMYLNRCTNEQRIQQRGIHFGAGKFLSHADLRLVSELIPEVSENPTGLGMRFFEITSKDMSHDICRAGSTKQVSSVEPSRSSGGVARKTHFNNAQPTFLPKESFTRVQLRKKTYMSKSDMYLNRRTNEQRIPQRGIHFGGGKYLSYADLRSVSEIPEISGNATDLGMTSFNITSKDMLHDISRAESTKPVKSVESSRSRGAAAQKAHLNNAQPTLMPKESSTRLQFRKKTYISKSDMYLNRRTNEQRILQRGIHFGGVKYLSHANLRSIYELIPEVSGNPTGLEMSSFKVTSKDMLHDIYRAGSTKQVSSVESSRSSGGAPGKTHIL